MKEKILENFILFELEVDTYELKFIQVKSLNYLDR